MSLKGALWIRPPESGGSIEDQASLSVVAQGMCDPDAWEILLTWTPKAPVTEFTAYAVGEVDPAGFDADVLVLAERADGSGKWLEVQGPTAEGFTEQDRRLGQDTYCLVNENQATVYGGVESWSCDAARACISLNTKASQLLGAADGYIIRIPDPEDLALAKAALQRILGSRITYGSIRHSSHFRR